MNVDKQAKIEKARQLFLGGYNCAQAVFAAFAPEIGLDEKMALRLSGGFGGGMGGMRGVCGALSGSFMALGALCGYDRAEDTAGKKALYEREQAFAARFEAKFTTYNCKQLLLQNGIFVSNLPSERTPEYYKQRPCVRFVEWCAGEVADELNK